MISILILIICILSVISRNPAALTYAFFSVMHDQFELTGWQYYLSASIVDVIVIGTIAIYLKQSKITTGILYISFSSAVMNFYGYILWVNYFEPISYNIAFYFIYLLAIFIITRKDSAELQRFSNSSFFYIIADKVGIFDRSLPQEKRS